MSPTLYERERRSSRVFMRIRVVLVDKNQRGHRFRKASETIMISAHGGLLYLDQDLDMGSMLVLANPSTQDEQECREDRGRVQPYQAEARNALGRRAQEHRQQG